MPKNFESFSHLIKSRQLCDSFRSFRLRRKPLEIRLFRSESLAGRAFLKVGSNRHFPDFGEKCGKIGKKNRETVIHRRIELPTDENLFLRCYKWMYFPLTGTAFPR